MSLNEFSNNKKNAYIHLLDFTICMYVLNNVVFRFIYVLIIIFIVVRVYVSVLVMSLQTQVTIIGKIFGTQRIVGT